MIDFAQRLDYLSWANSRLGTNFQSREAVTLTALDQHANILGVVVFSRFATGNCEVTVVGERGKWLSRRLILTSLAYVFHQMDCRRVTAFIAVSNHSSLKLAQQLGFQVEGTVRDWFPSGDAFVLGLLRKQCDWLKERNGLSQPPAST